jgi:uncharacterized protein YndB with AHSA1/START domain
MNKIDDTSRKVQPAPLRVSRVFSAPRETVFKAWSSADHIKRWFCPNGYSVPEATVEMRVGGRFEVCMRSPEGMEHWTKGTFTEVVAPERLTIDHHIIDPCGGGPLFSAITQVKFSTAEGGTRMDVEQTYTVADPGQAEPMLKGAPEGWRQTLDKLEAEIARIQGSSGSRSVVHGAFHIERIYDATPEQVYKALSDERAKNRWFHGPQGWRPIERFMDFRVGGRERAKGRFEGGVTTTFDAIYHASCRASGSSTPTRCISMSGRFPFRSQRLRSSPQARDARSSRSASRARSSTATTMPASENMAPETFSTSWERH